MRLPFGKLWFSPTFRAIVLQVGLLGLLVFMAWGAIDHLKENLEHRGIESGFGFLKDTANFSILFHLIPYGAHSSYFQVFLVGLLNTLFVSSLGILLASLLGFMIGIASISKNLLFKNLARIFVETVRNIPLLLQLFFWYFVVLRHAPYPQNSIHFKNIVYITNRGIYFAKPLFDQLTTCLTLFALGALLFGLIFYRKNRQHGLIHGVQKKSFYFSSLIFFSLFLTLIAITFYALNWQYPILGKFNFSGGFNLIPEFISLLLALSIYTAAYIAEIVRMGINAVPKGQIEAAKALGLSRAQALRLVILPQAFKVMMPPLTNQYLNLTKNSSLATAIAFPDLVAVFAGTALNQTGQAIEIIFMTMAVYLFISLVLAGSIYLIERRRQWSH